MTTVTRLYSITTYRSLPVDLQWCFVHTDGTQVPGFTNMAYAIAHHDPFQHQVTTEPGVMLAALELFDAVSIIEAA